MTTTAVAAMCVVGAATVTVVLLVPMVTTGTVIVD